MLLMSVIYSWPTIQGTIELCKEDETYQGFKKENDSKVNCVANKVCFEGIDPSKISKEDLPLVLNQTRPEWKVYSDKTTELVVKLIGNKGGGDCYGKFAAPPQAVVKDEVWENYNGTVKSYPDAIKKVKHAFPEKEEESIYSILADAAETGEKVKVAASGYSGTEVCDTDGVLILTSELKKFASLDDPFKGQLMPDSIKKDYFDRFAFDQPVNAQRLDYGYFYQEVRTGYTIKELTSRLTELGLDALSWGGANGQQLEGAFATGTHGSGPGFRDPKGKWVPLGALHEMVVSKLVMTTAPLNGGKKKPDSENQVYIYRIEKEDGPSDPKAFPTADGVELIQDSDYFNTYQVGFGAFGVVISSVLRLVPAYNLSEEGEVKTWDETTKLMRPNRKNHQHLPDFLYQEGKGGRNDLMFNPYDNDQVVLIKRLVVDEEPNLEGPRKNPIQKMAECGFLEDIKKDIDKLIVKLKAIGEKVFEEIPESPEVIDFLSWVLKHKPTWTPKFVKAAMPALAGIKKVGRSPDIYDAGYYDKAGTALELSVPISDQDGNYQFKNIELARNLIMKKVEEFSEKKKFPILVCTIRICSGDDAVFSMLPKGENSKKPALFAIFEPLALDGILTPEELKEVQMMLNEVMNDLQQIPGWIRHIGLDVEGSPERVKAHPKYKTGLEVYKEANALGTFNNTYTKQCKLGELVKEKEESASE